MKGGLYDWRGASDLLEDLIKPVFEEQARVREQAILNPLDEKTEEKLRGLTIPEEGLDPGELREHLVQEVYGHRTRINHPRFFSFIPNPMTPYSVIAESLNASYNPYGGGSILSPGPSLVEKMLLNWLGEKIGYEPEEMGGVFVSGGSMANLTGAVMARDNRLEAEDFTRGTVYVSDQTHSSVAKAIKIIGIRPENVRKVESDGQFRMDLESLEAMIREDIQRGFKPFLLVGTCGTTNTGAIDPLEKLAHLAKKYDLWYHIDGAYGASYILSKDKDLLRGIELSDSLAWDAHKLLFQTYGCAMILARDLKKMLASFSAQGEYLKDVEAGIDQVNFWNIGIEMTTPMRGMRLYTCLNLVGLKEIRRALDRSLDYPRFFQEEISKYKFFQIVSKPSLGVINFRYYRPDLGEGELNRINQKLSQMGLDRGYAVYYTTILKGKTVLRFCSGHSDLSREEIGQIINYILEDLVSLGLERESILTR